MKRIGASIIASALVFASPVRGDPTKDECINADESAQGLRASGRLREAANTLTFCVARSCPGPVRNDCSERLNEVQRALPTVVFAVRSERGDDLTSVRVLVDGTLLTTALGGSAIAVDPGSHTFAFEAKGFTPSQQETLIREGEKERSVLVVLATADEARAGPGPGVQAEPAARDAAHPGLSTRRVVALLSTGLGLVGLGVGGVHAFVAKSAFDTAEQETGDRRHSDSVSAVNAGNVATVLMSVGGVLAGAGVVLWLTAPGPSTQVVASYDQVFVRGTF